MKKIYLLIAFGFIRMTVFADCTDWAVNPNTQSVPYSGGNYSAQVTATGYCTYNLTMNDPWLHFVSYGSNGVFYYSVDPNICGFRSGTISINDVTGGIPDIVTLVVNQYGETTGPPSNDEPANAIPLSIGTSCLFNTFSNCAATGSSIYAPSCGNYQGADVWFAIVVPSSGHLIIDSDIGTMTDGAMAVYSGSYSSMVEINCDDDASANGLMPFLDLPGLPIGQTIFIRFWGYGGATGTFQICVYDGGNAPPVPTGFTATATSSSSIFLSWNSSIGAMSYDVYTCGGSFVTNTLYTSYTVSGLNQNTYYDFKVRALGSLGNSTFTSCQGATTLIAGPSNDDCNSAITLIPNSQDEYISGSTLNATQSQPVPSSGWCYTDTPYAYDVWYKFVATCTSHHIKVQGASDFSPVVELEDAACGNMVVCDWEDPGGLVDLSYLFTVGNTYYFRVYNNYTSYIWATGTEFQVCVTPSCIANDDCNFAANLVSGLNCNYTSGSTLGATQSQPPANCATINPYSANDVWYKFTAIKSHHILQVLGTSDFEPIVVVEDAPCGTALWCDDGIFNGSKVTIDMGGLIIGNTYFIRVYDFNDYGHFQICVEHDNTGIEDLNSFAKIDIYPNPSNGKFTVNCNSHINSLEIYNVLGEKIQEINPLYQQASIEIDISNKPKGIYFAKMYVGLKIYTTKIVVQ
jgi:Secretion system C-terminal sorting domain